MPTLLIDPEATPGPVMVTLRYGRLGAEQRGIRRSHGAGRPIAPTNRRDQLGALPQRREADRVRGDFRGLTWEEHQRQHEARLTGADREVERRAHELADSGPEVAHLFPAAAKE